MSTVELSRARQKTADKRDAIRDYLKDKGWTIDRFGHAKKEYQDYTIRYKFQVNTIRKEKLVVYTGGSKSWVHLATLGVNGAHGLLVKGNLNIG